jgi:hypothetical protein
VGSPAHDILTVRSPAPANCGSFALSAKAIVIFNPFAIVGDRLLAALVLRRRRKRRSFSGARNRVYR